MMNIIQQFPFLLALLHQLEEAGIPIPVALNIVLGIAIALKAALDAATSK